MLTHMTMIFDEKTFESLNYGMRQDNVNAVHLVSYCVDSPLTEQQLCTGDLLIPRSMMQRGTASL